MSDEKRDLAVAAQYEALPYPSRDPRDETRRLIIGSPSHLAEIEHYLFQGRIARDKPFRALVAGGGTGDATIMLAQQAADAGLTAEITYLDQSAASRHIAEARAAARGLVNIRFLSGSLLELPALGLGPFDYIDCCGVLHHLEEPAAGLAALTAALAPHGGMGLMLYGTVGRSGIYELQEMLRDIAGADAAAARIAITRKLLAELPATNGFKLNPALRKERDDSELFDLLLHARDRAYGVLEIGDLLDSCALRLVGFIDPASYDPAFYVKDELLLRRAAALPAIERAAIAERLAGNLPRHVFYVTHRGNDSAPMSLEAAGLDAIPVLRDPDCARLVEQLGKERRITGSKDGLDRTILLPPLGPAMLRLVDGRRSLRDIQAALGDRKLDEAGFLAAFAALYRPLNGINWLLLRSHERPFSRGIRN
jgi:2-polyprenyl-3-methyl-5-hydroxy-6-metoxy-1,4-benzoquinol methylase